MIIRLLDIIFSITALIVLAPFLLFIILFISLTDSGSPFYLQNRVGKNGVDFKLLKFRTMIKGADKSGLLTIGQTDQRITPLGGFLRKYKLDELPQLFNILKGEMSFVGPRPEVRKYVELYNEQQRQVLKVKPGLTDSASLEYYDENELLANETNPEEYYIKTIMPAKIKLNLVYINNPNLNQYFRIIFRTFNRVITNYSSKDKS